MTWQRQLQANPFGTMAALSAAVLGTLGVVMGDGVSKGMTNSLAGHANVIAHLWGVMFAIGGLLKLYGLYSHRLSLELPGLYLMAGGYAFYSLTVVTGLHTHGLAAGVIAGALALGSLVKANAITSTARQVGHLRREGGETG